MIDPNTLPPNLRRAMERQPALQQPKARRHNGSQANPAARFEEAEKRIDAEFDRVWKETGEKAVARVLAVNGPESHQEPVSAVLPPKATKDSGAGVLAKKMPKIYACNAKAPPKTRQMNKTERRFADMLDARKRAGDILHWIYEGIRLKWGGSMHYTGDFVVFTANDCPTIYEVKGAHIRDRDIVRFKGCRAEWPQFPFEMWQWKNGVWTQKY